MTVAALSGPPILLALACIAVVIVLLWIPVLSDRLMDFLSRNAPRVVPRMLAAGAGLLVIGLVAGIRFLDIAGASLLGLLVLGLIAEHY